MTIFFSIIIALLIIILIFTGLNQSRRNEAAELEDYLDALHAEANALQQQINQMNQIAGDRQINNAVNLTNQEIQVLDQYERSGIKLPVDVIEQLHYMRLHNDKDMMDFIENQRKFWKLENSKPVYKMK